jgi:hypothetical protein
MFLGDWVFMKEEFYNLILFFFRFMWLKSNIPYVFSVIHIIMFSQLIWTILNNIKIGL